MPANNRNKNLEKELKKNINREGVPKGDLKKSNNKKSNNTNKVRSNDRTRGDNFNRILEEAVKDVKLKNGKTSKSPYSTEKEYQDSFSDILAFEKQFTDKEKKDINMIIFHDSNNDGVISAYLAWKYLVKENKKDIKFFQMKPGKGDRVDSRIENLKGQLEGSNVLVLDLDYNKVTIDFLRNNSKSLIFIDDHMEKTGNNNMMGGAAKESIFIGKNHAAVAYTWKFFYLKE